MFWGATSPLRPPGILSLRRGFRKWWPHRDVRHHGAFADYQCKQNCWWWRVELLGGVDTGHSGPHFRWFFIAHWTIGRGQTCLSGWWWSETVVVLVVIKWWLALVTIWDVHRGNFTLLGNLDDVMMICSKLRQTMRWLLSQHLATKKHWLAIPNWSKVSTNQKGFVARKPVVGRTTSLTESSCAKQIFANWPVDRGNDFIWSLVSSLEKCPQV